MFYNYLLICYDKDLETLSWIIWLNPKCRHVCPYKRQAEADHPEIPPSSRDEGLRLLHGLATNLATSLQTPQET